MNNIPRGWLDFLREQYPPGSRIEVREMKDPYCPVEPGSMGDLLHIDDAGTFHVQWDNGRSLGLVLGEDRFSVLPPEPQTLKLFMPLTADYYEPDEWGDMPEESYCLDGRELRAYEDSIRASLLQERMPEEAERGLMAYFDGSDAVNEKVVSFFPSVEEVDGRLYGVAVRQLKEALTPGEMAELKEYCSCQYADGWGEGYEQRPRRTSYGELYVSFWQAKDFFILTKEEMETSRAASRPPHQPKRGGDAR